MNRQEVVIALAKINMMNKQVAYWIELDQDIDNIAVALDLSVVPGWIDEILVFMKNNSCRPVVTFAHKMFTIDFLKKALKASKRKWKSDTYELLSSFAGSIEKLYSTSNIYYKMYKRGPYGELEDALSNAKGAELLKRAIDAGYLDCNYFPKKGTTPLQLKAIAWGVGQALGIRWRQQWITFERQWNCDRVGTVPVPEGYSQQYEDVKALYPEVDFSPLTESKKDEFFKKPLEENCIEELFLALITYGYIDKKTPFFQFQRIFGIKDDIDSSEFQPIDWLKDQRSLTYFVFFAFSKRNKDIWVKTQNCFLVNGKKPNKGSLKSGMQALRRDHSIIEQYDPCLITLANQFNRKK